METPDGPREESIHFGVYVDDLAIVYKYDDEHSLYSTFTRALEERWKVEDEGDIHDLLGIEFLFGAAARPPRRPLARRTSSARTGAC